MHVWYVFHSCFFFCCSVFFFVFFCTVLLELYSSRVIDHIVYTNHRCLGLSDIVIFIIDVASFRWAMPFRRRSLSAERIQSFCYSKH